MELLQLLGLVCVGILAHLINKLAALEAAGTVLNPITYIRQRPYQSLSAAAGALVLAYGLFLIHQLTEFAALMLGVGCSEAWDALRARAAGKIRELAEPPPPPPPPSE